MNRLLSAGVRLRLGIYQTIFPIAVLFMLPGLVRRMMKRGNFRRNLGQRFGIFSDNVKASLDGKNIAWLQSISVGETNIALRIAREWLDRDSDLHIVISVTTSTGFDLAARAASDRLHVIYNPIDLVWIVRKTLAVIHPLSLVLVEGTWPALVAESKKRGIPVSLVTRLSPRSARRFRKFRWFTGPIFNLLDHVFVQEPEEIATWQELGAKPAAIHCTGAIKYDEPPTHLPSRPEFQALLGNLGITEKSPVLLGGSTFPGEEFILTKVYLELKKAHPDLFLILVPRHVERTPEILAELRPLTHQIALRTESKLVANPDLLIIDTTGELRDWYALATIVFIGKSLTSTGGQNPVEPVLASKPVLFGPHMENFASIVCKWLAVCPDMQVADELMLTERLQDWLQHPEKTANCVHLALQAVTPHFGATCRVVDLLISGHVQNN